MSDLREHRICNARHGQVTCYCSAIDWMTLDEYGDHIEHVAAIAVCDEVELIALAIERATSHYQTPDGELHGLTHEDHGMLRAARIARGAA